MNLLISVQSGSLSEHIFLWLCSQPLIETLRSDGERIRGLDREGSDDRKRGATNRMSEQIPLLVLFSICALWKCLLLLSLLTRCAIVVIFSIADAIYIKFNWLENQIDSIRTAATTASTMDPTHICLWPGADCAWESPGRIAQNGNPHPLASIQAVFQTQSRLSCRRLATFLISGLQLD